MRRDPCTACGMWHSLSHLWLSSCHHLDGGSMRAWSSSNKGNRLMRSFTAYIACITLSLEWSSSLCACPRKIDEAQRSLSCLCYELLYFPGPQCGNRIDGQTAYLLKTVAARTSCAIGRLSSRSVRTADLARACDPLPQSPVARIEVSSQDSWRLLHTARMLPGCKLPPVGVVI